MVYKVTNDALLIAQLGIATDLTLSVAAILEPRSGGKIIRQQRLVKLLPFTFQFMPYPKNDNGTHMY